MSYWEVMQELRLEEKVSAFDEVYWFDAKHLPTCREAVSHFARVQEVDLSYPIILSDDGHVTDGMHRVAKAWHLGLAEVRAVQFPQDPAPDRIIERAKF